MGTWDGVRIMANWVEVTEEHAKGHPLYGVKGGSIALITGLTVLGFGIGVKDFFGSQNGLHSNPLP